jgi:hypothetical protein
MFSDLWHSAKFSLSPEFAFVNILLGADMPLCLHIVCCHICFVMTEFSMTIRPTKPKS